jgi:hypothetical protein
MCVFTHVFWQAHWTTWRLRHSKRARQRTKVAAVTAMPPSSLVGPVMCGPWGASYTRCAYIYIYIYIYIHETYACVGTGVHLIPGVLIYIYIYIYIWNICVCGHWGASYVCSCAYMYICTHKTYVYVCWGGAHESRHRLEFLLTHLTCAYVTDGVWENAFSGHQDAAHEDRCHLEPQPQNWWENLCHVNVTLRDNRILVDLNWAHGHAFQLPNPNHKIGEKTYAMLAKIIQQPNWAHGHAFHLPNPNHKMTKKHEIPCQHSVDFE